jgi:hypothetical protein
LERGREAGQRSHLARSSKMVLIPANDEPNQISLNADLIGFF